jgi:hypothetical protein
MLGSHLHNRWINAGQQVVGMGRGGGAPVGVMSETGWGCRKWGFVEKRAALLRNRYDSCTFQNQKLNSAAMMPTVEEPLPLTFALL